MLNIAERLGNFYTQNKKLAVGCTFLFGFSTIFASAPFFLCIFLLIPFGFLADILYNSITTKQRITRIVFFSFGYHLANFYWMLYALTVDASFYWIIPFGAIFICSTFTLMLLFSFIPYLILSKKSLSPWFHYLGISSSWITFEFIKEYFPFGGLPWQGIGMIFAANDYIIQIAYYIGIFGCNILAIFLALLPFIFLRAKFGKIANFIAFTLCAILMIFGYFRLNTKSDKVKFYDTQIIGVQANVPIEAVFNHEDQGLINYITQSQIAKELPGNNAILIWPEATISAYSNSDIVNRKLFTFIMSVIPQNVKYLIFGSIYFDKKNNKYFNRMSIINRQGNLIGAYDKRQLVPFGEYIPPRNFFPFLTQKITKGMIDLSGGTEYNLLEIDNIKFAPLICFESAFAGRIIDKEKIKQADMILQISEDAWFGNSNGPYQHLVFSKFLSVIYKTQLIRVSNSGVSAVYNEYGEILQSVPLNTSGFVSMKNLAKKTL